MPANSINIPRYECADSEKNVTVTHSWMFGCTSVSGTYLPTWFQAQFTTTSSNISKKKKKIMFPFISGVEKNLYSTLCTGEAKYKDALSIMK